VILTDTHTHLYSDEMEYPVEVLLKRAGDQCVSRFFIPNIDKDTIQAVLDLGNNYPGCYPMLGLHPVHVDGNYQEQLTAIENALSRNKVVAIGEVGLDLYHSQQFLKEQQYAFLIQARMAASLDLPLVIHCRNAFEELMELFESLKGVPARGIFHCFGGSLTEAEKLIGRGFYLGIGGILTYKNAGLAETLKNISLEHLVLETDAPYLSPVPRRGKVNESANLLYIAQKLADLKNVSVEEVAAITTANSRTIFGI